MKRLLFSILLVLGLFAASQLAHATTGTTFTETFNQGSGKTCAGSSACIQRWSTVAGTTASIVAASGCATGFNFTNALKFASNATNSSIQTFGTIPVVPSGTDYDIFFEMCWDSSTWQANKTVFSAQTTGGSQSFLLATAGSGTGNFFANGATTFSGGAASTRHLFHMNRASGVCNIQVDGGSNTSFTCNNQDLLDIVLTGFNTGANLFFGNIYINSSVTVGTWPPSAFSDWVGMSGTPTAAQLKAGTHCGNANTAQWTVSGLTGVSFTTTTGGASFPAPLAVCGTNYTGNTNVGLQVSATTAAGSIGNWTAQYQTVYPAVSIGMDFVYTGTATTGNGFDPHALTDGNGTIYTFQVQHNAGVDQFCIESNSASTSACIATGTTPGTHYWISYGVGPTGGDTLYVYTRSTMVLFGSVAATGTARTFVPGSILIGFGKLGSETQSNAMTATFSNVIVQYADAVSPVLPPVAVPHAYAVVF